MKKMEYKYSLNEIAFKVLIFFAGLIFTVIWFEVYPNFTCIIPFAIAIIYISSY